MDAMKSHDVKGCNVEWYGWYYMIWCEIIWNMMMCENVVWWYAMKLYVSLSCEIQHIVLHQRRETPIFSKAKRTSLCLIRDLFGMASKSFPQHSLIIAIASISYCSSHELSRDSHNPGASLHILLLQHVTGKCIMFALIFGCLWLVTRRFYLYPSGYSLTLW